MNLKEKILNNQKLNKIDVRHVRMKADEDISSDKNEKAKKKTRKNYNFMAFSIGEESLDNKRFTRYHGVAPVSILSINPSKSEIEAIYGREDMSVPEYVSTTKTFDGKEVPQVRIDFITITDEEKVGVANLNRISFYLTKQFFTNKDNTKVKVIDKYTRTCWITNDEYKSRSVPTYTNGPARIDAASYRPVYRGEEELTNFMRAYLGIQDSEIWNPDRHMFVPNPDMSKCECIFDNMEKIFKGDISEIKDMWKARPDNKVKVMFGVRVSEENKLYTDAYREKFLKYSARLNKNTGTYPQFEREININVPTISRYLNTSFYAGEYKEYVEEPTNFEPAKEVAVNPSTDDVFTTDGGVVSSNGSDDLPFSDAGDTGKFPWE